MTKKDNLIIYLIAGYFVLWVILFEFILPVNNILPKPSVVLLALPDLFRVYHLGESILSSVSAIYLSISIAWMVIWVFRKTLFDVHSAFSVFFSSLEWFSKFVPGIILSLLIVYWFPQVEYMKYLFIFLIALISLMNKLRQSEKHVPGEYLDSVRSLGFNNPGIIKWKYIEPLMAKYSLDLHLYLWSMLLVFEYIKGGYGLGSVFRTALTFNDISGLFASFLITGVIVWIGTSLLKYYSYKYFIRE